MTLEAVLRKELGFLDVTKRNVLDKLNGENGFMWPAPIDWHLRVGLVNMQSTAKNIWSEELIYQNGGAVVSNRRGDRLVEQYM